MHHYLVCSSIKLDTVVDRVGLVHNSIGTMPLGSQFLAATFLNCRSIQPNSIPHLESLPIFLLVKCQLLLLMGLLQVTANHVIGISEVLMALFLKLW